MTPRTQIMLEVLCSVWDWLWVRCASCGWTQAEDIRRGKPLNLPAGFGVGPCACGSSSFIVLERRPHPNHREELVQPRALPVLS